MIWDIYLLSSKSSDLFLLQTKLALQKQLSKTLPAGFLSSSLNPAALCTLASSPLALRLPQGPAAIFHNPLISPALFRPAPGPLRPTHPPIIFSPYWQWGQNATFGTSSIQSAHAATQYTCVFDLWVSQLTSRKLHSTTLQCLFQFDQLLRPNFNGEISNHVWENGALESRWRWRTITQLFECMFPGDWPYRKP